MFEHRKSKELTIVRYVDTNGTIRLTREEYEHGFPSLTELHGCGEKQNLKSSIESINAVVEKLTEWTTLLSPASVRQSVEAL